MPRPDRGVAQRYAAKKRKKRASINRLPGAVVGPPTRSATAVSQQAVAGETTSPLSPAEAQRVTSAHPAAASHARGASARPFSSYASDYRYVLDDLRRVGLVAGSLFLSLIVLSFFVR